MSKSIDVATRTIHLQSVGRQPAVEAQELNVGDTLMWNSDETTEITAIVDASLKFLRITEKSARTGEETERRLMKTRLVARVAQASQPEKEKEQQALTEQFPMGETFVYEQEDGRQDVVIVRSAAAADGTVLVDSVRHMKEVTVPADKLRPLPELPPAPEGEITDWWTVTDGSGAEIARVQGDDDPGARTAAMRNASVRAVVRRDRVFAIRRLRTSELSVPVGELRELYRTAPAAPVHWWSVQDRQGNEIAQVGAISYDHAVQVADEDPKVRAAEPGSGGLVYMRRGAVQEPARTAPPATPARSCTPVVPAHRTITVRTEYIGRSIPTRLEAAGAPGGMKYSNAAGALRWVLPGGEELTPGEAAERFLS